MKTHGFAVIKSVQSKKIFEEDIFGNLKKVLKEKVILNWNFGKSKCLPF